VNKIRIGLGYDIHRLVSGRRMILGGVEIPFDLGLDGHSDADVVSHAIIDALLGAASLGDIGTHFPDDDPAYKDADSIELLKKTRVMVEEKGFAVGNIDVTIIAEEPKLAPYILKMKRKVAEAAGISPDDLSIKATTNEKMDAIGKGEGIAAISVALLYL
jgi:2-C-methyl-D-erythritol 2,4-cyclodiphosphate synthase